MSAIKLDAELRARLNGLEEAMEVQDEKGEIVGHFVPAGLYRELLYAGRGNSSRIKKSALVPWRNREACQLPKR